MRVVQRSPRARRPPAAIRAQGKANVNSGSACPRMTYRGHILIIFGLSLVMSPWAIRLVEERKAAEAAARPAAVITQGQADAACNGRALETVIGRLGCNKDAEVRETRRIDSGGALFVQAKRN